MIRLASTVAGMFTKGVLRILSKWDAKRDLGRASVIVIQITLVVLGSKIIFTKG